MSKLVLGAIIGVVAIFYINKDRKYYCNDCKGKKP